MVAGTGGGGGGLHRSSSLTIRIAKNLSKNFESIPVKDGFPDLCMNQADWPSFSNFSSFVLQ